MPDELTDITIRPARDDDEFQALMGVLYTAFGDTMTAEHVENERAVAELDRIFGAFEGDTPVGVSGAYTFRLTVPGGEVGAAGVTLVGVLPTHTRRGILRAMMTRLFEQAAERGEPVAILGASEAAIYQRFGYGNAAPGGSFEAAAGKITFLTSVEVGGRFRIVERDEAVERFGPIFEAHRRGRPGSIGRSDAKWRHQLLEDAEWMRGGAGSKVRVLLEVDGEARAYAIYRIKADWDPDGPKNVITVFEVLGVDAASEQAMWQWLFRVDLVSVVKGWRQPVPQPLHLMITEPRRLNVSVSDGLWLRILDVPAALAGRTFRGPGSLVLELTDDFLPANAGRRQLTVRSDGAPGKVAPTTAEPDVALDISALSTIYLGAFTFADLARAGRVRECRPGAAATADTLFTTPVKPWNSTMF